MEQRNFDFNSFDIEKANNSKSLSKIRHQIDLAIDTYIKEDLRDEINSKERPNTIWIIDSRLAWNNIPKDESFSVRLTADDKIAGERAYNRFLKSKLSEENYESLEQAIEKTAARKKGENDRYKERYNVDLDNPNNYKLIVDTSNLTVEEEAKMIIEAEQKLYTEKGYISPKDKDEYDGEDR